LRNVILFAIIGLLFFGCVNQPPAGNNTQPVISVPGNGSQNGSLQPAVPYPVPPDYTVSLGDQASVLYTLWVDGKVYDTNDASVANESGIYSPDRRYQPLNFTVIFNSGIIDGFVINTIGLKLNETIEYDVDPQRGYGLYNPADVVVTPRYYNKSMYETIPRAYFTEKNLDVSNGTSYNTPYGPVFIYDSNEDNVTIFYVLKAGEMFALNGIPQKVVRVNNGTATIEFAFTVNETYALPDPKTGARTMFTVTEVNPQNITLDGNHPLANKTLHFRETLLDVVSARK
jgi:FKBP-type peptidyl-prolyl cis-trans isomerase 2